MFEIRDGKGEVFNRVKEPAVVFDRTCGTVQKIGEYNNMEKYFNEVQKLYRESGHGFMADDLILMELPKDQEVVDKVFNNVGYVKKLYEQVK